MTEQKPRDLELPDEMDYPLQLREKYELLEYLSGIRKPCWLGRRGARIW